MNLLTQLAYTTTRYHYYDEPYYGNYNYQSSTQVSEGLALGLLAIIFFCMLISVAVYVASALGYMKMLQKAKDPQPWAAWVPVYNTWKLYEMGGYPGWWAILAFVPLVNFASLVFLYLAMYEIGQKFGKDKAFILLGIFLPPVWFLVLGFDKSKWQGEKTKAKKAEEAEKVEEVVEVVEEEK